MNFLLHFIFIATFFFLYIVSIIILRPLRIHRKRPVSTISLKVSYLAYLIVFLVLAYLVLFFSDVPKDDQDQSGDSLFNIYYAIVIFSFFIPNIAIMLRRKVDKLRTAYNIIFTAVNLFVILALSFILYTYPWKFS
jgi:hypothetical protein